MIRIQLVDENNFDAVLQLRVAEKDQRRVAENVYSLAQAWLYRDRGIEPLAITVGKQVVGFMLLDVQPTHYFVWRLMIDSAYQNQQFGKTALQWVIQRAKQDPQCQKIIVDYVFGNHKMRHILEKLGFQTETIRGNEVVMVLTLNQKEEENEIKRNT